MKKQTTILISDDVKKRLLDIVHQKEDETGSRWSYAQIIDYLIDCYGRNKMQ